MPADRRYPVGIPGFSRPLSTRRADAAWPTVRWIPVGKGVLGAAAGAVYPVPGTAPEAGGPPRTPGRISTRTRLGSASAQAARAVVGRLDRRRLCGVASPDHAGSPRRGGSVDHNPTVSHGAIQGDAGFREVRPQEAMKLAREPDRLARAEFDVDIAQTIK